MVKSKSTIRKMTIDEAIKNLNIACKSHHKRIFPEFYDATMLGIEALKRLRYCRPYCEFNPEELLPGEKE